MWKHTHRNTEHSEQPKKARTAGTWHAKCWVHLGIGENTSSWISAARVLFSVALSISLTLGPLTSHLRWA